MPSLVQTIRDMQEAAMTARQKKAIAAIEKNKKLSDSEKFKKIDAVMNEESCCSKCGKVHEGSCMNEKTKCPKCEGKGCDHCGDTGYHEETQVDELSKKKLGNYVKDASKDAASKAAYGAQLARDGDTKKAGKMTAKAYDRTKKIGKAVDRLTKEDLDEATAMTSGPKGSLGGSRPQNKYNAPKGTAKHHADMAAKHQQAAQHHADKAADHEDSGNDSKADHHYAKSQHHDNAADAHNHAQSMIKKHGADHPTAQKASQAANKHKLGESINEDMNSAAKELEAYARKNGGIDKGDFMKAAVMMKRGQKPQLNKFVDELDTEPREKILSVMSKHMKEEVELAEYAQCQLDQMAKDLDAYIRKSGGEHKAALTKISSLWKRGKHSQAMEISRKLPTPVEQELVSITKKAIKANMTEDVDALAKDFEVRLKKQGYSSRTQDRERMATLAKAKKQGMNAMQMKQLDGKMNAIMNKMDESVAIDTQTDHHMDLLDTVNAILMGKRDEIEESSKAAMAKKLAKASQSSEKGKKAVTLPKAPWDKKDEAMDPVDKKALKKNYDDRKDKDIDNDGDEDDSDEYLHKKRQAVSKAVNKEAPKKKAKKDTTGGEEPVDVNPTLDEMMTKLESKREVFERKYGDRAQKVMEATAEKMAVRKINEISPELARKAFQKRKQQAFSAADQNRHKEADKLADKKNKTKAYMDKRGINR